jgi:hypothetical protein
MKPLTARHQCLPRTVSATDKFTSTDDEQLLQCDINSLQEWSDKWELSFNVQKCSVMWFTRKKNVMPANYHLANEEIKSVNIKKTSGYSSVMT